MLDLSTFLLNLFGAASRSSDRWTLRQTPRLPPCRNKWSTGGQCIRRTLCAREAKQIEPWHCGYDWMYAGSYCPAAACMPLFAERAPVPHCTASMQISRQCTATFALHPKQLRVLVQRAQHLGHRKSILVREFLVRFEPAPQCAFQRMAKGAPPPPTHELACPAT